METCETCIDSSDLGCRYAGCRYAREERPPRKLTLRIGLSREGAAHYGIETAERDHRYRAPEVPYVLPGDRIRPIGMPDPPVGVYEGVGVGGSSVIVNWEDDR